MRDFDEFDDMFKKIQEMMDREFTGGYKNSNIRSKDYDVDIQEDDDHIYITMEIKVREEDLTVTPKEDMIVLEFMDSGSWNKKTIKLSSKIDPKKAKITFNNCILDIQLCKVKEEVKNDNGEIRGNL
jgi:HSP20 family molecular chaperone IbpA